MQRLNSLLYMFWRRAAVLFLTVLVVLPADQLSKLWIKTNLTIGESLPETGFFRLTNIRNSGASFGLFQGHTLPLIVISIIGASLILFLTFFIPARFYVLNSRLGKLSLGLIFSGAVGNLIDRIGYGYVTDFIAVGVWPPFNVADSATVVGAVLLAYLVLQLAINDRRPDEQKV